MANPTPFIQQLEAATETIGALQDLLEREFEYLRNQELDAFQGLQPAKLELLKKIQLFDQAKNDFLLAQSHDPQAVVALETLLTPPDGAKWVTFLDGLRECDQLHRKIDFYLGQKIKTTNAILEILQVNKAHNTTQLYDAYGNNSLSTIGNKISEA